jgi:hypothetical protein
MDSHYGKTDEYQILNVISIFSTKKNKKFELEFVGFIKLIEIKNMNIIFQVYLQQYMSKPIITAHVLQITQLFLLTYESES